jgi:hypothetical protein
MPAATMKEETRERSVKLLKFDEIFPRANNDEREEPPCWRIKGFAGAERRDDD